MKTCFSGLVAFAMVLVAGLCTTPAAQADGGFSDFSGYDVVFLGEVHDNPAHHARQAEIVAQVQPDGIVWEMLTGVRASAITPEMLASEAVLGPFLYWEDSGWPDFGMYYPIFAASDAQHFGAALPRGEARAVMGEPVAEVFGSSAALFGLDRPLPADQQAAREALQRAAHCDALPDEMLPVMVDIQRLRDARIAAVVREALAVTGGPVVVITGNGHARKDWGAPALLAQAMPELRIGALGQGEDGAPPEGVFDRVDDAPGVEREDPCAEFR
ncbi:ChaN family lipoprotein [Sagittula salina]|uniref:ChaN family lipoprotein n=1 Tax=Sagittula salina TaxID=2820268 RepID=A0A940S163_9RHOB|nr:ChaN family lipoprotein [Sagittula salina]MBP0482732.1 ChaN family lipoprotein [Sagittula salina]